MIILVLNCGSSSIKYQVIDIKSTNEHKVLATGMVDRVGFTDGVLKHKPTDKPKYEIVKNIPDHTTGINLILNVLTDSQVGVISSLEDLNAVGHRVVHGGEYFADSVIVDKTVIKQIEECFDLAPLHNPANLRGVMSIENILPGIPQVTTFDTSFHQSMPKKNYLYALPYRMYEDYRVRKYGFHGTSHKFVAQKASEMVGIDYNTSKIITCHIGNGASVTAIKDGKSLDTSMGFTPVDGLIMGTRSGSVDPSALVFIAEKEHLSMTQIGELINKQSGVIGITNISSDMREIENARDNGNERAILALDMYYSRIKNYVGQYAAMMEGVDLIVFTGGVGENDSILRYEVCKGLEFMGVEFDVEGNRGVRSQDKVLSLDSSKVKVAVATTNEELVIAMDTFRLLKKRSE